MSEVKRAKLISFGSQRVNSKNSQEYPKTCRISVNLPESTEDKCPEFNYKDLFAAAKKKKDPVQKNCSKQTNGLDPFAEDDEDVKRIAAEMEAKYGMGVAKKRKWKKDDFADIGMGYDESDSFIDNTDGYDEIVPKNVTTVHGGFYINCGALEFKVDEALSPNDSSSSDEEQAAPVSRKRVIESSAESEAETETDKTAKHDEKKQKLVTSTNGMQKAIKKRLFSHDKIKQMANKRPTDETNKTVRQLLRERREDLDMSIPADLDTTIKAVSSEESKKTAESAEQPTDSIVNKTNKPKDEPPDDSSKDSFSSKDGANNKIVINSSEADSNDAVQLKPVEVIPLPENLPTDIIEIIDKIKRAAAVSTEGKVKFFQGPVNTMLLNLERKCRCLGKQSRMRVYEHLAPFVKCRKETLIKRAKNLVAVEEQKKIKLLLDRLKSGVDIIMPSMIKNYEAECKAVLEKKFSAQNEESAKNLRLPRRHFVWNDDLRKLLKDIITLRKKCYLNEGRQKDTLENHLTEFIKTELHTIWPDNWVSVNTLLRLAGVGQDVKKAPEMKKTSPTSSDITISPSSISTPPNIAISSSALTITPVISVHKAEEVRVKPKAEEVRVKPKAEEVRVKPKAEEVRVKPKADEIRIKPKPLFSETIISKINCTSDNNVNKVSTSLPAVDIVRTSPDVNNIKSTNSNSVFIKNDSDLVIEEVPLKKEDPENLSSHTSVIKHELTENSSHCQIIDLTDTSEIKKKSGVKSKTKYHYPEYPEKPKLEKKDLQIIPPKEELTGSLIYNQIIADSLSEANRVPQKSPNNVVINTTATSECGIKRPYDYSKPKTSEGDDILKVMEGLKVLQKMSSPVKSEDVKTGSPVSVIAFNKSYAHETNSTPHTPIPRSNSFQDAFQKHFIPDYHLMKAQNTTSPPKGSNNSIPKPNHVVSKSSTNGDHQNSNNIYNQQNSQKLKSSSTLQSGSYNLFDDMLANFLNEYGYSKTVNSKSSTPHK